MASVSISEDFVTYLKAKWLSVTGHTVPDLVQVLNFDRNRRIQGFRGSYTNGVVLVHRGTLHFIPLDFGFSSRTWGTSIMIHGKDANQVETLILDLMSVINDWEANGFGDFVTGGLAMTSFEVSNFDITMEKTAVGEISFFSKQTARS